MKIELIPKWQFKTHPNIKVTKDRKIFNSKTGRLKKYTVNGGSVGVWLDSRKFVVKKDLNSQLERVDNNCGCPF